MKPFGNLNPADDYERALRRWTDEPAPPDGETLFSTAHGGEAPFAPLPGGAGQAEAVERVAAWTRARFALAEDAAVLVSEVACTLPGCPPLETVIAFWEKEQRYHFKLFKPLEKIAPEDLPYAWLKETLAVSEGFGCECC